MKIAVLSDIHDNIWNLDKVLKKLKRQRVRAIVFCGDMCAPFTAAKLSTANTPIYACLGNADEDHLYMAEKGGKKIKWTPLGPEFGEVKLDKRTIAYCHYPKLAELLAKSGEYDAVFHGHTHNSRNEKHGKSILVNPGSVCGIQKGKPGKASYAIYDTKTNTAEVIVIS